MAQKKYRETKYVVTEDGVVFNSITGHALKPIPTNGYFRVEMTNNDVRHRAFIHRMVAECFIENSVGKPQVNHKNRNKKDNRVENLEWCTREENMRHCYLTNHLVPSAKIGGPKNAMSEGVKSQIIELFKSGVSIIDIHRISGVKSNSSIYSLLKRRGLYFGKK